MLTLHRSLIPTFLSSAQPSLHFTTCAYNIQMILLLYLIITWHARAPNMLANRLVLNLRTYQIPSDLLTSISQALPTSLPAIDIAADPSTHSTGRHEDGPQGVDEGENTHLGESESINEHISRKVRALLWSGSYPCTHERTVH